MDSLGNFYDGRRAYADTLRPQHVVKYLTSEVRSPADSFMLPSFRRRMIAIVGGTPGFSSYTYQPLTPDLFWTVLPDGRFVLARGDRYAVTVHSETGEVDCEIERHVESTRVTATQRKSVHDKTKTRLEAHARAARLNPSGYVAQIRIPEYHPYVMGVEADHAGRIWVRVPTSDNEARSLRFDVFEWTGQWLGTVDLEASELGDPTYAAFGATHIYVAAVSVEGVHTVHAYSLPAAATQR